MAYTVQLTAEMDGIRKVAAVCAGETVSFIVRAWLSGYDEDSNETIPRQFAVGVPVDVTFVDKSVLALKSPARTLTSMALENTGAAVFTFETKKPAKVTILCEAASPAASEEPFELLDPAGGLETLSSYRASLSLEFNGSQDGEEVRWLRTYRMSVERSGEPWRMWEYEASPVAGSGQPIQRLMAENSSLQFEKSGQEACLTTPLAEVKPLAEQREPADRLPALSGPASQR